MLAAPQFFFPCSPPAIHPEHMEVRAILAAVSGGIAMFIWASIV
jgi:hypothetical protein